MLHFFTFTHYLRDMRDSSESSNTQNRKLSDIRDKVSSKTSIDPLSSLIAFEEKPRCSTIDGYVYQLYPDKLSIGDTPNLKSWVQHHSLMDVKRNSNYSYTKQYQQKQEPSNLFVEYNVTLSLNEIPSTFICITPSYLSDFCLPTLTSRFDSRNIEVMFDGRRDINNQSELHIFTPKRQSETSFMLSTRLFGEENRCS